MEGEVGGGQGIYWGRERGTRDSVADIRQDYTTEVKN